MINLRAICVTGIIGLVVACISTPASALVLFVSTRTAAFQGGIDRYDTDTAALIDTFMPMAAGSQMGTPGSMAIYNGSILVGNRNVGDVNQFDAATGAFQSHLITHGNSSGLVQASRFTLDPSDGSVLVASNTTVFKVLRYDAITGARDTSFGINANAQDIAIGPDGYVYMTTRDLSGNSYIGKYDPVTGALIDTLVAPEFGQPRATYTGLEVANGKLYVGELFSNSILELDLITGDLQRSFVSGRGLLVDFKFGPDGDLYVATGNQTLGSSSEVLRFDGLTGAFDKSVATGVGFDQIAFGENSVPEPGALSLFLAGLGLLGFTARRHSKNFRPVSCRFRHPSRRLLMSASVFPRGLLAAFLTFMMMSPAQAILTSVHGQGTWETTLLGRDADGKAIDGADGRAVALYDSVLDITWMRTVDTTARGLEGPANWDDAEAWLHNFNDGKPFGYNDWRLPMMVDTFASPKTQADGCNYSNAGGTDCGFNVQTTTSELAHLYYVTLGNVAYCEPDTSTTTACNGPQSGFDKTNIGYFQNFALYGLSFWTGLIDETSGGAVKAWYFDFSEGYQDTASTRDVLHLFAVRAGDVLVADGPSNQVPEPQTLPLTALGLVVGQLVLSRRREAR
jgi:hypothetical protein